MSSNNGKSSLQSFRSPHILTKAIKENKDESVSLSEWIIIACKQRLQHENNINIDLILAEQETAKQLEKDRQIESNRLEKKKNAEIKQLEKKERKEKERKEIIDIALSVLKNLDDKTK